MPSAAVAPARRAVGHPLPGVDDPDDDLDHGPGAVLEVFDPQRRPLPLVEVELVPLGQEAERLVEHAPLLVRGDVGDLLHVLEPLEVAQDLARPPRLEGVEDAGPDEGQELGLARLDAGQEVLDRGVLAARPPLLEDALDRLEAQPLDRGQADADGPALDLEDGGRCG